MSEDDIEEVKEVLEERTAARCWYNALLAQLIVASVCISSLFVCLHGVSD